MRGSFDELTDELYAFALRYGTLYRVYQTMNYITEKNGFMVNYLVVETKLKIYCDITRISEMVHF